MKSIGRPLVWKRRPKYPLEGLPLVVLSCLLVSPLVVSRGRHGPCGGVTSAGCARRSCLARGRASGADSGALVSSRRRRRARQAVGLQEKQPQQLSAPLSAGNSAANEIAASPGPSDQWALARNQLSGGERPDNGGPVTREGGGWATDPTDLTDLTSLTVFTVITDLTFLSSPTPTTPPVASSIPPWPSLEVNFPNRGRSTTAPPP
ncbi:unnamed protein product [Lampetra fluviatilis]